MKHYPTWDEAKAAFPPGYEIVAVDNVDGAEPLTSFDWSPKTIMLYGEEQRGLSPEALALADRVVYIPMRGSVRSFNVGTASGIVMYSYVQQHG